MVRSLTDHLGEPMPSPALLDKIGNSSVATLETTPRSMASRFWR